MGRGKEVLDIGIVENELYVVFDRHLRLKSFKNYHFCNFKTYLEMGFYKTSNLNIKL